MKSFLTLFALIILESSFAQNLVYFPGFELINMESSAGLQYSTSKLIKSYIEDNHDYTVLLDDRVGSSGYLS